jgi:GDPmannose 4,6-dehydratase
MLQQEMPQDFVIATGQTHTVREFVEKAFNEIDITIAWQGEGINEVGVDTKTGNVVVQIDPKYFRPTEVDLLLGDPKKAKKILGWQATTTFDELVKLMVASDCEKASRGLCRNGVLMH